MKKGPFDCGRPVLYLEKHALNTHFDMTRDASSRVSTDSAELFYLMYRLLPGGCLSLYQ
jgi:hypothetical protein